MFGKKLKMLRKKNRLTQANLAKKLNISPSTIGMYEQGRREPDSAMLVKIADLDKNVNQQVEGVSTSSSAVEEMVANIRSVTQILEGNSQTVQKLGAESEKSHQAIGRRVSEVKAELVYLVGPEMKAAEKAADGQGIKWFDESNDKNFEAIAADINLLASDNDVILLKGSHSMQLEKLVPLLCGNKGEAC